MRVADALVAVGGWLVRDSFVQPVAHWRNRTWDGFRAESHDALGAAYVEERAELSGWIERVAPSSCVLDVGAGTGRYSLDAARAGAAHVTALDVSQSALDEVARRAAEEDAGNVIRVHVGDFWRQGATCRCGRPFDLVMCMDAIHHLGQLPQVIARLHQLAGAGGVVIGDVWTRDNFGEFQRARRGTIEHTLASLRFVVGAAIVASGLRPSSDAVRSDLRQADEVRAEILSVWPDSAVERSRYWVRFLSHSTSNVG